MLKTLLKKQLLELNQTFFQNKKTGKARSKAGTAAFIILYAVLVAGVLGGSFYFLATSICGPLVQAGMDWMYFLLFILISLCLGVFGSVFSTYSGLYCAKDNDLLLSMPIPVGYILAVRLIGIYLMGLMFSAIVLIPAAIVYWIMVPVTAARITGPLVLLLGMSVLALVLSCILGYGVAGISRKLKNKSMATTALSLLFIAAYYFVYFKANEMIRYLIGHASEIGGDLKASAYFLYLVGCTGTGDILCMTVFLGVAFLATFLTCWVIARSFLKITTSSGNGDRKLYKEKTARVKSVGKALLIREFAHLGSSANYMLNCSLGTIFILAIAVVLILKGEQLTEAVKVMTGGEPGSMALLIGTAIAVIASMNDLTAPSVSLEGKSMWVVQSMPVHPWKVLKAKIEMHLLLTSVPLLVLQIAVMRVFEVGGIAAIWVLLFPQLLVALMAEFGLILNLKFPNLKWSSEVSVVKQSMPPLFCILGGWVFGGAMLLPQLIKPGFMDVGIYMWLWAVLSVILTVIFTLWLKKRGSEIFASL